MTPPPAATLPRLLAGCSFGAAMGIRDHVATHGELPKLERRQRKSEHPLIEELYRAGLRGHGGAAYPTGAKLRAVAGAGSKPVVVVNGCEGEPTSRKDHLLLEQLPHLVLDGAVLAAQALDSHDIIVAVENEAMQAGQAIERAVAERFELGSRGLETRIVGIPAGYVSGQDTSVVQVLNGGAAMPTVTPPYPATRGVAGRPTLVSNAETLAHLALIARHGAAWYRALGTREQPGSRLMTLLGAVARPGVLEVANGTSLHAVVKAAGGATEPLGGFLLGGYAGTWVDADSTAVSLEESGLRKRGATLGAGILFALPATACPVAEVARVARWLANNNAGQCGPCVNGLAAIAGALEELAAGGDRSGAYGHLKRWCRLVSGRGACAMPDGAARFVRSALRVFAHDFDDHARNGRCDDCLREPLLPVPDRAELFVR
jgi:NADH:ubiquinone oxidoreductase subunit F (NADH-binding)